LEAFMKSAEAPAAEFIEAATETVEIIAETLEETAEDAFEAMADAEAEAEAEPEPEIAAEAAPEPEPAPAEPDDLTRIVGIGPKLSEALAARGVTRFAQIAAWTSKDLAELDVALSLKGRAVRDAWVAQASRMGAGTH